MEETTNIYDSAIERYNSDTSASGIAVRSLDDIKRISTIFISSGMFKGGKNVTQTQQVYQAGVKIIAGVEFGIAPFAAMRGINIINGNAEMSANLMAAKVKKHPKYDYRVKQWDNDGCVLTFYEIPYPGAKKDEWDELGDSSFNIEDARTAGLAGGDNWRKFARNMYFARAMSNGVRIYTPDVFYGAPVYVEGEISGEFESHDTKPDKVETLEELVEPQEAEIVADDIGIDTGARIESQETPEPPSEFEIKKEELRQLMEEAKISPKSIRASLVLIETMDEVDDALTKVRAKLGKTNV